MLFARVVKLVDAGDSKSPAARRAGSSPALGTNPTSCIAEPPLIGGFFRLEFEVDATEVNGGAIAQKLRQLEVLYAPAFQRRLQRRRSVIERHIPPQKHLRAPPISRHADGRPIL